MLTTDPPQRPTDCPAIFKYYRRAEYVISMKMHHPIKWKCWIDVYIRGYTDIEELSTVSTEYKQL